MKLNFDQITSITNGASRIIENEGIVSFYRFTEEQDALYKDRSSDFYKKSFSTSGITLRFRTDAKSMKLDINARAGSSRTYFTIDVLVDGKLTGAIENHSSITTDGNYLGKEYPLGDFSKNFDLGEGDKEITVVMPWSVAIDIKELSLDATYITPVKRNKKLLAFGDSITHGYDAVNPSNKYITKLCKIIGAEEYNKGIGGEIFFPQLADTKESFTPDYITVAYGTNDWKNCGKETFETNMKEFYTRLSSNYPDSKIFAITPIWRGDINRIEREMSFAEIEEHIKEAVEDLKNVTVIAGFGFVPQDEQLFMDRYLHPNDNGFDYYYNGLYSAIKELL